VLQNLVNEGNMQVEITLNDEEGNAALAIRSTDNPKYVVIDILKSSGIVEVLIQDLRDALRKITAK
jgi:hypothetical protein